MTITNVPLTPRFGRKVPVVAVIGRISTPQQDVENIEASYRFVKDYLKHIYDGELDIRLFGEQASGMLASRRTIQQVEDLIAAGEIDVAVSEDLGRIFRNPRFQYLFVQDAVDAGVRVICIGDSLDTADENWEINMATASLRHGMHIPDTRRRVKRTATHAFHSGGMVQRVKFGYRKLTEEEADSGEFGPRGLRIAKIPECTPVISEMCGQVMDGKPLEGVADWLNTEGIDPGPYVTNGRWCGRLVADLLRDPILSGTRQFRKVNHKPVFATGKHRREKNPQPEEEHYPELAHISAEEQASLLGVLDDRDANCGPVAGPDSPRHGKARSRSYWPGQAATCAICGGPMHLVGQGMKCAQSLARNGQTCWNHVQVPIDLCRERMIEWLTDVFDQLPEAREAFVEAAWMAIRETRKRLNRRRGDAESQLRSLEQEAQNLVAAIKKGGKLDILVDELGKKQTQIAEFRGTLVGDAEEDLFPTKESVISRLREALHELMRNSYDFADVLRRHFPVFEIQPVQALDTGQVRARAKLQFILDRADAGQTVTSSQQVNVH